MFDLQIGPVRSAADAVSNDPAAWNDPLPHPRSDQPHLLDTTMLFAPRSGGVKRYLTAKADWFHRRRPGVRHTLLVPGDETVALRTGLVTLAAPRLPFADGYRWPSSVKTWAEAIGRLAPDVIEAGDPYGPGHAALLAGERLGAPVVGFCHTDPAALAALHLGEWAAPPVRKRWANVFRRFDAVLAPSWHIAERLADAGVGAVDVQPLGVDVALFRPALADRAAVLRELGLSEDVKLLIFAGRSAREKNIDALLGAVTRLGPGHHLLLVGAGAFARPQSNVSTLPFERDPQALGRLLASADAFVHANPNEPFGLIALEAMACGTPVVGVASGGIGEIVDHEVGELARHATPAALADAVAALVERDQSTLRTAARRRAVERHSWEATFVRLSAFYGRLAACGRAIQGRPAAQPFALAPSS